MTAETVNVSPRQAQTIAAVLFEDSAATGPMKSVHGEWLVREASRLWPRWAGLRFFARTNNKRRFLLASYHHPARLCWSWSLQIAFGRHGSYRWPYLFGYRSSLGWAARIPFLLEISFNRQSYDWMLSSAAKQRLLHIVDRTLGTTQPHEATDHAR